MVVHGSGSSTWLVNGGLSGLVVVVLV